MNNIKSVYENILKSIIKKISADIGNANSGRLQLIHLNTLQLFNKMLLDVESKQTITKSEISTILLNELNQCNNIQNGSLWSEAVYTTVNKKIEFINDIMIKIT